MKTKYFFPEKDKVGEFISNRLTLQKTLKGFSDIRSMIPTGKIDQKKEIKSTRNGKNERKHKTHFFLFLITLKDNCQSKYNNNVL